MKILAVGGEGDSAAERRVESSCLLIAMGASGNRRYGSNKRILPNGHNVCLVPRLSLLRKLMIKGPLTSGRHAEFPEVTLFSAERLVVDYPGPLLFQTDGEVVRMEAADFPLEMRIEHGAYRALAPAVTV
jgi:diacylglycerol kinase family enzyme